MATIYTKGPLVANSDVEEILACHKAIEFAIEVGFTDLAIEIVL